jgi:hypothetical protein
MRASSIRARAITERAKWIAVIALAFVGCPASSRPRRQPLDAGVGACAVAVLPTTGEECSNEGADCDFTVACSEEFTPNHRATERCACSAGRWRCSTLPCDQFLPDGGGLACPALGSPLAQTFACDPRLEGRTCTIAPFACWNGTRPRAACVCDGTNWRCPEAPCPPPTMLLTESAGRACTNDWACESLLCDASRTRQGFCTGRCDPNAPAGTLQLQCGSTLAFCAPTSTQRGEEGTGFCTRACVPGANACPLGLVCAQLVAPATAGTAACVPFCRSDDDCPVGVPCRVASGQCATRGESTTLLEDGELCTDDPSLPFRCRGRCVRLGRRDFTPTVCASVYYMAGCPVVAGLAQVERRVGELTYCFGARCDSQTCCPSGTVCESRPGDSNRCAVDTPLPNIDCADSGVDVGTVDAGSDAGAEASDAHDRDTFDSASDGSFDARD